MDCNTQMDGTRSLHGTNGFCFTPCLEKFIPQASMITLGCNGEGCKNRMLPYHREISYYPNGETLCDSLTGYPY